MAKTTNRSEVPSAEMTKTHERLASNPEQPRSVSKNSKQQEKTRPNFYCNLKIRSSQRYPSKELPIHSGSDIDPQHLETRIIPKSRPKIRS